MSSRWEGELDDLVARRSSALVGYAYTLSGNVSDAEDLVQEALTRVFSSWRRRAPRSASGVGTVAVDTAGERSVEGYVRQTILNLYLDGYRRRGRWSGLRHRVATPDEVRGPASGVAVRADVVAALAALSPRQRSCIVLRYLEDMSVAEAAEALGVSQGTVKRQVFEGLARLRGVLGDDVMVLGQVAVTHAGAVDTTTKEEQR
ncbi:sigma-70 family RNA polymerase sigma factor [Luteimicrobium subarcticum]|uniref:RNA polymerase sigma factor (Sigma-70 family) n=1 Tax=Luteimicrobium subarcticum TaxID=620910 RepID=A0A2M8WTF1_9MICO|nr:sigma-70 family RNA polymerase sigma factor [Luteimicrobium subarcticum]PJI94158.1 RNA polymerase sigma factor (sigma-70 family) [Luteimicrobium subarcticum]